MNVYLIMTPHQLMNALEARHYFGLKDNYIIIIITPTYPDKAFTPLLEDHSWENVTFLEPKYNLEGFDYRKNQQSIKSRYLSFCNERHRRVMLNEYAKTLRGVSSLILGNYEMDFMKHFSNQVHYNRLIALDDGTATLRVYKERRNNNHISSFTRIKKSIREMILGLDTTETEKITFYTTYDLKPVDGDIVINNEYTYLKQMSSQARDNGKIYFLGQQFVEMKILNEDVYIDYMKKIKEYYNGEQLAYIAHKHEDVKKIERIETDVGLEVQRFDVPIEYRMSVKGDKPKVLAGFSSSAIENCERLFAGDIPINVFVVKPEHLMNRKDFVLSVYDYYRKKAGDRFVMIPL